MTPEQKLEQDYKAVFAALRDEKNQQISEYQAQAWKMAQRANEEEQRAEYLKAEIERINANAEQDRDERDAYRGERDALQARIDGALAALKQVRAVPNEKQAKQDFMLIVGIDTWLK